MDERTAFAVRSVLNLAGPPTPLEHPRWEVLERLRDVLKTYPAPPVEFHGVRNSVPDILVIAPRAVPGAPARCVYTERHFSVVAVLKTLAIAKLGRRVSRTTVAHNFFLTLAADYFLQQGALGDAARLFCASFVPPTRAVFPAVDAGLFSTLFTNPVVESALVDGGWPLAHELGHTLADSDQRVVAVVTKLLDQYLLASFDGQPPAWGARGAYDRLVAELTADWFGAELLLRSIGGRSLDQDGLLTLLTEFSGNMWVMMLMESCKELVRIAATDPRALARQVPAGHRGWLYDVRRQVLIHSIRADLQDAFGNESGLAAFDYLIEFATDLYRPNFGAILAGLSQAQRTMLHGPIRKLNMPLLQEVDPDSARSWDHWFRRYAPYWVRNSVLRDSTREFVNRARATQNFRDQPTDLIDYLDRLVPDDVITYERRRLDIGQIDSRSMLPFKYGSARRLRPMHWLRRQDGGPVSR
ncbi:hypothetical protein [Dactylosporangium matsuzakiense]|nr:hypothetical protein [Dactylosporangium matsuzakiense]UWZ44630.1 hypothetical protein Dmats_46070 [Dactylosporangium matsuzakiense]